MPATILLITPAVELANSVYGTLERTLGARAWVWHEPAMEPGVRVLGVCRFRLLLLDVTLAGAMLGSVLRALKEAAPQTPLALLAGTGTPLRIERQGLGAARARLAGAAGVVARGDAAALERVVRQILAMSATDAPDS